MIRQDSTVMSWGLWISTLTTTSAALVTAGLAALLAVLNTATSPRSKILSDPGVYFINILTRKLIEPFWVAEETERRFRVSSWVQTRSVNRSVPFFSVNVFGKHKHLAGAVLHEAVLQRASERGHRQYVDQRRLGWARLFVLVRAPLILSPRGQWCTGRYTSRMNCNDDSMFHGWQVLKPSVLYDRCSCRSCEECAFAMK